MIHIHVRKVEAEPSPARRALERLAALAVPLMLMILGAALYACYIGAEGSGVNLIIVLAMTLVTVAPVIRAWTRDRAKR